MGDTILFFRARVRFLSPFLKIFDRSQTISNIKMAKLSEDVMMSASIKKRKL
jgi:hypothetical protein